MKSPTIIYDFNDLTEPHLVFGDGETGQDIKRRVPCFGGFVGSQALHNHTHHRLIIGSIFWKSIVAREGVSGAKILSNALLSEINNLTPHGSFNDLKPDNEKISRIRKKLTGPDRTYFDIYHDLRIDGDDEKFFERVPSVSPNSSQYIDVLKDKSLCPNHILDIGAFDGADSATFLDEFPGSCVTAFEPNISAIHQGPHSFLGNSSRVKLLNFALADQPSRVTLAQNESRSTTLNVRARHESPEKQIVQTTLDALTQSKIVSEFDYLKIDTEGNEKRIIEGAAESIKKIRPVLAVAVYHQPSDFYEIPCLLLDLLGDDCNLHFRFYSETFIDFICYLIPR